MDKQYRSEQMVQGLHTVFIVPMDNRLSKRIYVVTQNEKGQKIITPYFISDGLSFDTTKAVRKDLGLPELVSAEDIEREIADAQIVQQ